MGNKKKETLIDDLVDDLTDAKSNEEFEQDEHIEGSLIDFSSLASQKGESEEPLELDIDNDLTIVDHSDQADDEFENKVDVINSGTEPKVTNQEPPEEDPSPTSDFDSSENDLKEFTNSNNEALDEEELVRAYEETLAGEQQEETKNEQFFEKDKVEEPDEDLLDHTEKVDLDLYNASASFQSTLEPASPTESKLAIAENFRIAKLKISEMEKENERLTLENEELTVAAETFRNKVDALEAQVKGFNKKLSDQVESAKIEKEILMNSIAEKENEVQSVAQKSSQLESRVQMSVRKVKVRERELENRLELVKLEGKALLKSKDELILNLKKQIDKLGTEIEALRSRVQENNRMVSHKQEVMRKTVKSLRLALSLLEVEDIHGNSNPLKKVD